MHQPVLRIRGDEQRSNMAEPMADSLSVCQIFLPEKYNGLLEPAHFLRLIFFKSFSHPPLVLFL